MDLRQLEALLAAIAAYRRASELDPKDAKAYYGLGYSRRAQGDVPGAVAARQDFQNGVKTWYGRPSFVPIASGSNSSELVASKVSSPASRSPRGSVSTVSSSPPPARSRRAATAPGC